jgi:hypothetical protein
MDAPRCFTLANTNFRDAPNHSRYTLRYPRGFCQTGCTFIKLVRQTRSMQSHPAFKAPPLYGVGLACGPRCSAMLTTCTPQSWHAIHAHEIIIYARALHTTWSLAEISFWFVCFCDLFSNGLGSLGEIRCCNEAVHIERHRATDKKTEPSKSEVVTTLLLQYIQFPLGSESASAHSND